MATCVMAQETVMEPSQDSVQNARLGKLEHKASALKSADRRLGRQIKLQEEKSEALRGDLEGLSRELAQANVAIDSLEDKTGNMSDNLNQRINKQGEWNRTMFLWTFIIAVALLLVVLIVALTGRARSRKEIRALEARVDNAKEEVEVEVKQVLRQHQADMEALKKSLDDLKK